MLYYNNIIMSIEQIKTMGIFLSEIEQNKSKINKYFILQLENDGMDEYTLMFRQMYGHIFAAK